LKELEQDLKNLLLCTGEKILPVEASQSRPSRGACLLLEAGNHGAIRVTGYY